MGKLRDARDPTWQASWQQLVESYRKPMERYATRILGRAGPASAQDAGEVVQEFLTACLEGDWFARAQQQKGQFRVFVRVLLRRFIHSWLRARYAKKRRPDGDRVIVSLSSEAGHMELADTHPQDAAEFDRSWAEVAVERALARLREESPRYHTVIHDLILTHGVGSEDIADRVDSRAVRFAVIKYRAGKRFSAIFEEELRATVRDPEAFKLEWQTLQPYLP